MARSNNPPSHSPSAEPANHSDNKAAIQQMLLGVFDADWYLQRYPEVAKAGLNPQYHFLAYGVQEHRNPNRWFDSLWYRRHYPDIDAAAVNPLLHYLQIGATELRNPHPRFDALWYVNQYPEAAANPLLFHLRVGFPRGYTTEKTIDINDYLASTAAPLKPPRRLAVDIVVPVYRGLAQTRRCLESVLADAQRPAGSRVIVIDDHSPEKALSVWLDQLAATGHIVLLRNPRNLGFVGSVNRGMTAAGNSDVVLLNSDTEVPQGWLTRLAAQAYAEPHIATVSPFSNNATICSYSTDETGPMPFGASLHAIDAACRSVNAGRSINVPTTVGFCMYIRREALNEVGLFDEKTFGRGYGEENDFCLRASSRGWQHRLACDTFVYHEGSVSFRAETGLLARQAMTVLTARYPEYLQLISRHARLNEAAPFRFALTMGLFRASGLPTILLVSHCLGGGISRHIDLLMKRLAGQAHFLQLAATPGTAALSIPGLDGNTGLSLAEDRLDELLQLLRFADIRRVHIHHLAGMDADIQALIQRLGVPFDLTIHDYYPICPQVNLLPLNTGRTCGEPSPAACNACIANRPAYFASDILGWRRQHNWLLLEADRVLCPSRDVRDRLARHAPAARYVIAPHEAAPAGQWRVLPRRRRAGPLRIAVLGTLADHKGAHVVAALAEAAAAKVAKLEIRLIGSTEDNFPTACLPLLQQTGEYQEAELPDLLQRLQPDVVWFPASWPETYSYTLSAALAAELPVVACRIGAFPERLAGRPLTWLVDPTTSTTEWIATFAKVQTALVQAEGKPARGKRAAAADFYATDYLAPALVIPALRRGAAAVLTDLRRSGRTSVVIIPERLESGIISPCAYIRLLQPLDHAAVANKLDIVIADVATALRYRADIFVTQRHAIDNVSTADALIKHAKSVGAALVYDIDDDLLHIPRNHVDAATLRPQAKLVQRLVQRADRVLVSTAALAASLRKTCRRDMLIVPNALDERLWCDGTQQVRRRLAPVRILCMGTATHDADFALIAPALARLKQDFGADVEIDLLGFISHGKLPEGINRLGMPQHASKSYPGFVNWMVQQPAWDIGLAPLADSPFNHCKSSIKTLDYAALGLAVLASEGPVYRGSLADGPGGMLVANEAGAWYAALSRLVRDRPLLQALQQGAKATLQAKGTLASQARARLKTWLS